MRAKKSSEMARDMALAKKSKIPPGAARAFVKADLAEDRGMMPMGGTPPLVTPKKKPGGMRTARSRAY